MVKTSVEQLLMGHTMVPLKQAIRGGLEHDCSSWDKIYEAEENAANAFHDPTKAKRSNDRNAANVPAIAQTANALDGAEIVLWKTARGTVK